MTVLPELNRGFAESSDFTGQAYLEVTPHGKVCAVTDFEIPATGSAEVHVLHEGYVGLDGDDERVSGTVTLIIDGDAVIVVDPGMVADRGALLAALAAHGPRPEDVTDVVFSHHHPDHTVNAALFPNAKIHDHWAVYEGDRWLDRDADGAVLAPVRAAAAHPGAHQRGHLHGRLDGRRRVRVHARLVVRRRAGIRPARHRRGGAAGEQGSPAGDRRR